MNRAYTLYDRGRSGRLLAAQQRRPSLTPPTRSCYVTVDLLLSRADLGLFASRHHALMAPPRKERKCASAREQLS